MRSIFTAGLIIAALAMPVEYFAPAAAQDVPSLSRALPAGALDGLRSGGAIETAPIIISPLDGNGGERAHVGAPLAAAPPASAPPSPLERDYSGRVGTTLKLFGRDLVAVPETAATLFGGTSATGASPALKGAAGDGYIIGIGDELVISTRGATNRAWRARVDREGRIIIPELSPVAAAGRHFGEVRSDFEVMATKTWPNTEIFLSLGQVRQISVTVVGQVAAGSKSLLLSGFSTLLDALAAVGGISSTGSLRHIEILHAGAATPTNIDLYDFIVGRPVPDLTLTEGDRIVVPPLGPTIAIAGAVARPAIFELPPRAQALAAEEAIRLAGGLLRPSGNRFLHVALDAQGKDRTNEVAGLGKLVLRPSDLLIVSRSVNEQVAQVGLDGHVRIPGTRSLTAAPTVRDLVGGTGAFPADPYLAFAALLTTDRDTLARQIIPIDLGRVLKGDITNPRLADGDVLVVLGMSDIRFLASTDVQAVLAGKAPQSPRAAQAIAAKSAPVALPAGLPPPPTSVAHAAGLLASLPADPTPGALLAGDAAAAGGSCRGLQTLAAIVASSRAGRFANAVLPGSPPPPNVPGTDQALTNALPCPSVFDRFPELLPFILEYGTVVSGEVRAPGIYPVPPGATLDSVVSAAAGVTRDADLRSIEITRFKTDEASGRLDSTREVLEVTRRQFAAVIINPGDVVRFNPLYLGRDDGPVTIIGEVKRPGIYDIRRGEKLSSVMARAGGITAEAYPYGAVLTRERIKAVEREGIERSIRELEADLGASAKSEKPEQVTASAQVLRELVAELRQATPIGRLVVEADPDELVVHPERDVVLEPGDRLVIPKRPNSVTVSGDVLNPSTQAFQSGLTGDQYIDRAGGVSINADRTRIFVVLPNGEARPLKISFWNFTPSPIPPGSIIVVPKDLSPDLTAATRDITQIAAQLAITAASLVVIGR